MNRTLKLQQEPVARLINSNLLSLSEFFDKSYRN